MNKLLKLTGISILAIVATTNANAAGYTCEELIEYTSCNTGYYLNDGECIEGTTCGAGNYLKACPDGWTLYTGYCGSTGMSPASISEISGYTYEECAEESAENGEETRYLSSACGIELSWDGEILDYDIQEAGDVTCTACSAGSYQPNAGQYSCITCPAGSYCGTTGLSAVSGQCDNGQYSSAGATACSNCPATGLKNSANQDVVAITGMTGATSAAACYVSPDTYFTDVSGTYHYTQNCSLRIWEFVLDTKDKCEEYGLEWDTDGVLDASYGCLANSYLSGIKTETACNAVSKGTGEEIQWDGDSCACSEGRNFGYVMEGEIPGWQCVYDGSAD